MSKLKKVVGYCRFSSELQTENSIEAQKYAIETFCSKNGMEVIRWYCDRGKSGTNTKGREEFRRMIKDSKDKEFEMVIVHRFDRFSRNARDSFNAENELNVNSVQLLSVVEYLQAGPQASLMRSIYYGYNEYYSKSLSLEVLKGSLSIARKGLVNGGNAPLGYYVKEDKTYGIVEKEAEAIRLIYELYLLGMTSGTIVDELAKKGYTNKKGELLKKNSLSSILRNEKYTGKYIYNKVLGKGVNGKRNGHKYKDKSEWVIVDGAVPPIISEEVFQRVQRQLEDKQKSPGRAVAKTIYLLSGIVKCGCCTLGSSFYSMVGNRRTSKNKPTYVSYRCGNRSKSTATSTTCTNKEIRRDDLEDFVVSYIQDKLLNAENIETLCGTINKHFSTQKSEEIKKRATIQKEYDTTDEKIKNIIDAISNGFYQAEFKEKIEELKKRKLDIELQLKEVPVIRETKVTVEELLQLGEDFKEYVLTNNIPEIKRIIKYFIKKIIVDREQVKVILNLLSFLLGDKSEELEEQQIIFDREKLYIHLSKKHIRKNGFEGGEEECFSYQY